MGTENRKRKMPVVIRHAAGDFIMCAVGEILFPVSAAGPEHLDWPVLVLLVVGQALWAFLTAFVVSWRITFDGRTIAVRELFGHRSADVTEEGTFVKIDRHDGRIRLRVIGGDGETKLCALLDSEKQARRLIAALEKSGVHVTTYILRT